MPRFFKTLIFFAGLCLLIGCNNQSPTAVDTQINSTQQVAAITPYEAENATLTSGAKKNTNHTGYSGSGFVDGFYNSTTARVAFTVAAQYAGSYTVTLRYSAGNGTSSNTGLYVNGTKIKNITCQSTGNWNTWADRVETVSLTAGNNTIAYKAESSSGSCINLDKITLASPPLTVTPSPAYGNTCIDNILSITASATIGSVAWYFNPFNVPGDDRLITSAMSEFTILGNSLKCNMMAGSTICCIVTDNEGRTVKTGTWSWGSAYCQEVPPFTVTPSPAYGNTCIDDILSITASATIGSVAWYFNPFNVPGDDRLITSAMSEFTIMSNSLKCNMTAGSTIYCIVTDNTGRSVKSGSWSWGSAYCQDIPPFTVTPSPAYGNTCIDNILSITASATIGSVAWYFNPFNVPGDDRLITSAMSEFTIMSNSLKCNMTAGSTIYCIVTDNTGRSVKSGSWSWGSAYCQDIPPFTVTPSPAYGNTCIDNILSITASATIGSVAWYFNPFNVPGDDRLITSAMSEFTIMSNSLKCNMTAGSTIYCIVTDNTGRSVKSGSWSWGSAYCQEVPPFTVTPSPAYGNTCIDNILSITASATIGSVAWYFNPFNVPGDDRLITSAMSEFTIMSNSLKCNMTAGSTIYCIVTDNTGRSVKSGSWSWGSAYCQDIPPFTVTPSPAYGNTCIDNILSITASATIGSVAWYFNPFNVPGDDRLITSAMSEFTIISNSLKCNMTAGSTIYCIVTDNTGRAVKSGSWSWGSAYCQDIPANFTVSFNKNDATATGTMSSQTITSGATSSLTPNAFVKTGSAFSGWAATPAGAAIYADQAAFTMGTSDITLYAKWTTVSTLFEAENAVLTSGAKKNTNHTGYSGSGFVDGFYNSTTARVAFTVAAQYAGSYTVTLRYSAGNGTSSNTGLYVNGTKIKNTTCQSTGNWNTWADRVETVSLTAGNNTIAYKAESSSGSCINLDKITLSAPPLPALTVTPTPAYGNTCINNTLSVTASVPIRSIAWYFNPFNVPGDDRLITSAMSEFTSMGNSLKCNMTAGSTIYCIVTDNAGRSIKSSTWFWGSAFCP